MNAAQSTRRFRVAALLALMIALALGSFWVLEVMRRDGGDLLPNTTRTEPDFYVDKFSYVRMSGSGEARYHMSGSKLTHNPTDDSYDIQQPLLSNQSKSNPAPTTLRAERARVDSDYGKVHLYDNVHLDRPASPTSDELHVKSDYLLVLPDDDVVKTDKPVHITSGRSTLSGVGMFLNNATREFRLSSNVHGTYQAPTR
jgi:lipopolysaccharide export system protein LptC